MYVVCGIYSSLTQPQWDHPSSLETPHGGLRPYHIWASDADDPDRDAWQAFESRRLRLPSKLLQKDGTPPRHRSSLERGLPRPFCNAAELQQRQVVSFFCIGLKTATKHAGLGCSVPGNKLLKYSQRVAAS